MTSRQQLFNVGPDGTPFTAANSDDAGDDAVIFVAGGGTVTYKLAGAKEGFSLHVVNADAAAATIVGWDTTFAGTTFTARGYINFHADTASSGCSPVQVRTAAGSIGGLQFNTGRVLQCVYGASGIAMPSSQYTVALDTWYRFEFVITPGTTATSGSWRYMLYAGDSPTALIDVSVTGKDLRSQPVASFRWGKTGTAGSIDAMFDAIIAADDHPTPFGPLAPPPCDAGPDQTIAEGASISLSSTGTGTPNWTQDSGPTVTITNPTTATPSVATPPSGHYAFRVTYDGGSTDVVNVYVTTTTSTPETSISNAGGWTGTAANVSDGSDATYDESVNNPVGGTRVWLLKPLTAGAKTITVRYSASADTGTPTGLIELLNGPTGTAFASLSLPGATTTVQVATHTLTSDELAAIVDPRNVYVRQSAT